MAKLHVLSGILEGKSFDLIEERITVGRALDNMIRIDDGTVSHHHAMLAQEGGEYKLRDLNSTNGTRVNGLRIVETIIHNGDLIRFGSVEVRYESDVRKASQPLPPPKTGVDMTQVGQGGTPPPAFGSASPFGRKKRGGRGVLQWVMIGLGLIALLVLFWFVYKFLAVG